MYAGLQTHSMLSTVLVRMPVLSDVGAVARVPDRVRVPVTLSA